MSIPTKILHSVTPGAIPASLASGQLAINEADGALYYLDPVTGQPANLLDQIGGTNAGSNIIINGGMEVDQINRGNLLSATNGYAIDMVKVTKVGSSVVSTLQVPDAPPGLSQSLKVQVTAANAAPSANDFQSISFPVEGYRMQRLGWGIAGAQGIVIGFWVKAFRVGTYALNVSNAAASRGYSVAFTVAASSVWQWVTATIPGDVAGTWPTGSARSLIVSIFMMVGPSLLLTPNVWSSSVGGVAGHVNGVQTVSDFMQVTGVCMFPGHISPPVTRAPSLILPFAESLQLCQRYWLKSYDYPTAVAAATNNGACEFNLSTGSTPGVGVVWQLVRFSVSMRAPPAVVSYSSSTGTANVVFFVNGGVDIPVGISLVGENGASVGGTQTVSSATYNIRFHFTADARM